MDSKNIYRFKDTNFKFFKDDISFDENMPDIPWPRRWLTDVSNMLTDDAKEWLRKVGIGPGRENDSSRIFETKPNFACNIHNDGSYNTGELTFYSRWSINYVWGDCRNGDMVWFDTKPELIDEFSETKTTLGHKPQVYDPSKLVEIERCNFVSGLALVRIDIPHQVINHDPDFSRWCVSIRTGVIKDASWEDSINYFKEHLMFD